MRNRSCIIQNPQKCLSVEKKGGEKKVCRLAEGRDSKCRRVESMSKQSESRREPGDTEEAQRIWLSLEPWQGILAECAYMCVCLIPPAEGVNAVIQNWGICVKPHRRTGSRLCFVLSRSVAPSQENIKTKGVAENTRFLSKSWKFPLSLRTMQGYGYLASAGLALRETSGKTRSLCVRRVTGSFFTGSRVVTVEATAPTG